MPQEDQTVIGCDIGSRHIGFSILTEFGFGVKHIESGAIHSSVSQSEISWINYTYHHFRDIAVKHSASVIAIESPKSDSGGMPERLALMNRLIGCIMVLSGMPVPNRPSPIIALYTGEEVANHFIRANYAGKDMVSKVIEERLRITFTEANKHGYHASDAAAVALYHLDLVS